MRERGRAFIVAAVLGISGAALAVTVADPPDSQGNEFAGVIETADTPWSGTDYDVRHVSAAGAGHPQVITTLSSDSRDDLGARLVINTSNGDTWVAWWRDAATDQVLVRRRNQSTGAWTSERAQSASNEGSRHPSVAFDGTRAWIGYEVAGSGGGTVFKVKVIEDDPAPFVAATVVATTSYAGGADARLQAESGRLWLSWVDGEAQVGWSRYDAGGQTWSAPAFESYESDSVAEARVRIRAAALAN